MYHKKMLKKCQHRYHNVLRQCTFIYLLFDGSASLEEMKRQQYNLRINWLLEHKGGFPRTTMKLILHAMESQTKKLYMRRRKSSNVVSELMESLAYFNKCWKFHVKKYFHRKILHWVKSLWHIEDATNKKNVLLYFRNCKPLMTIPQLVQKVHWF